MFSYVNAPNTISDNSTLPFLIIFTNLPQNPVFIVITPLINLTFMKKTAVTLVKKWFVSSLSSNWDETLKIDLQTFNYSNEIYAYKINMLLDTYAGHRKIDRNKMKL